MELPKYKFYIGRKLNLTVHAGAYIDSNGVYGEGNAPATAASEERDFIDPTATHIYVNVPKSTLFYQGEVYDPISAVFFYSREGFIVKKLLHEGLFIEIPKKATSYAIMYMSPYGNTIAAEKLESYGAYAITEINPHYKSLKKEYKKENNQQFFRATLQGDIRIFGHDYELIANSNIEDAWIFLINKLNTESKEWDEYYKASFAKTDCKLDYSRCSCEFKLTTLDEYTAILNKYENKYDLIKIAPALSRVKITKRPLIQVYVLGSDTITSLIGGTYFTSSVDETIEDEEALVNKYHFKYNHAYNEFYVDSKTTPEMNGTYTGHDGRWEGPNGFYCVFEATPTPTSPGFFYIKKEGSNKIYYKSLLYYTYAEGEEISIKPDIINPTMRNPDNPADEFILDKIFRYKIYARLLADIPQIVNSDSIQDLYPIPVDDFVSDNKNYKYCTGLTTGTFYISAATQKEPTKFGMNDYGEYFTDRIFSYTQSGPRLLPLARTYWANASLWYQYVPQYNLWEETLRKSYWLRDAYAINNVIQKLLKKADVNLFHNGAPEYSQFLYANTNPLGVAKFYVFLTQKTNVLKGDYDQAAQKAETSLKEILDMLRDCFQCYWYIDQDSLKIEHISFFMNGGSYSKQPEVQFDFTSPRDMLNRVRNHYFQSNYEYDKSGLASRYEFAYGDESTEVFTGVTLDMKSNYIDQSKTESISVSNFSGDVDLMLISPSNFSNDGFALLCPIKNGAAYELPIVQYDNLLDENGNRYSALIQNWYASWVSLQGYYLYGAPAKNIFANTLGDIQAVSIKPCMKHSIKFPFAEDIDLVKLIKTDIGYGQINNVSIDLVTRQITTELVYLPK